MTPDTWAGLIYVLEFAGGFLMLLTAVSLLYSIGEKLYQDLHFANIGRLACELLSLAWKNFRPWPQKQERGLKW